MWTNESLELVGRNGRRIFNRYYRQAGGADKLAVIVAGFAYTLESPFLFYSKHAPFAQGWDVLGVDLEYSRQAEFAALEESQREAWLAAEIAALERLITTELTYSQLSFIGKSLGTAVVYRLLQKDRIKAITDRVVWLTPAHQASGILKLLLEDDLPGLLVYGDRDDYVADAPTAGLRDRANVDLWVVERADHALETDSVERSVDNLATYVQRLAAFFAESAE